MRKLPIGIQYFEKLRREGYAYVDKTALIHRLLTEGAIYFLSRPRRFGKSLLVSTLAAIFEGKRELFSALAIDALEWDWAPCPVVRIDMNAEQFGKSPDRLEMHLDSAVGENARLYGVTVRGETCSRRFANLLADIHDRSGRAVAVMVDEYDKPLVETLGDEAAHAEVKSALKAFYGVLKSADEHLRFGLLTGVTKFGQVSVFSDLNQLKDITFDARYATLCGITQEELERDFAVELQALADAEKQPLADTIGKVREWYNGYRFHPAAPTVYNPFSTLNLLDRREFGQWWYETGTPTFLVEMVDRYQMPLDELEHFEISAAALSSSRADGRDPLPVLLQAGYLTIKGYDAPSRTYTLTYPNVEVRDGFLTNLSRQFFERGPSDDAFSIRKFQLALNAADIDGFMELLQSLFASLPYRIHEPTEAYWQALFYLVFRLTGQIIQTEVHSARGRCDAVVRTARTVFVFEFKFGGTAAEAIAQVKAKGYAEPYRTEGRRVVLVGAGFDKEARNVATWITEELGERPRS